MYEDYLKKMKDECLLRNRAEGTYNTYENHVIKFLEWVKKNPDEVTLEDARNYIFEMRVERKMSTQHCNCINSALKFFYRHVLHIPWDQDAVPRMINDVRLPRVIPLEDVEKMIDTATAVRNKAIIALMYSSGLRLGEICRLAPEDIYMSTMQVHIRSGKNHCDHWTILSQRTLDLLTEYWKSFPKKRDFLFVGLKYPYAGTRGGGTGRRTGRKSDRRKGGCGRGPAAGNEIPRILHSHADHV